VTEHDQAPGPLHPDELPIDVPLVRRLLAEQLPALAALPLRPVPATGTVNVVLRLGDDLAVRLPRLARWAGSLERELAWLPRLAPALPLAVPEPVASGRPSPAFPLPWAVVRWLDGEPYAEERIGDEHAAARTLARFVVALRSALPTDAAPPTGRAPLPALDAVTRAALADLGADVDRAAVLREWERALAATPWDGAPVWLHTDLLRPNLLARDGRLAAVLDFGGVGVGDPAGDGIAAWSVFGPAGRRAYRDTLPLDDAAWERARGYALHQALLIVPYYRRTHPAFAAAALRTIEQVLADH
jgi:aminoglycoside phosphotransferase (APT) family kinase protein